jgi:hypothetical protein
VSPKEYSLRPEEEAHVVFIRISFLKLRQLDQSTAAKDNVESGFDVVSDDIVIVAIGMAERVTDKLD